MKKNIKSSLVAGAILASSSLFIGCSSNGLTDIVEDATGANITASDAYVIEGSLTTSSGLVATKSASSGTNHGIWNFATAPATGDTIIVAPGATKRISADENGTINVEMKSPAGYPVVSLASTLVVDTNETYAQTLTGLTLAQLKSDPIATIKTTPEIYQMNQVLVQLFTVVQAVPNGSIEDITATFNVTADGNITVGAIDTTALNAKATASGDNAIAAAVTAVQTLISKDVSNMLKVTGTSGIAAVESNATVDDVMLDAAILAGLVDANETNATAAITALDNLAANSDINVTATAANADANITAIDTLEDTIESNLPTTISISEGKITFGETEVNVYQKADGTYTFSKTVDAAALTSFYDVSFALNRGLLNRDFNSAATLGISIEDITNGENKAGDYVGLSIGGVDINSTIDADVGTMAVSINSGALGVMSSGLAGLPTSASYNFTNNITLDETDGTIAFDVNTLLSEISTDVSGYTNELDRLANQDGKYKVCVGIDYNLDGNFTNPYGSATVNGVNSDAAVCGTITVGTPTLVTPSSTNTLVDVNDTALNLDLAETATITVTLKGSDNNYFTTESDVVITANGTALSTTGSSGNYSATYTASAVGTITLGAIVDRYGYDANDTLTFSETITVSAAAYNAGLSTIVATPADINTTLRGGITETTVVATILNDLSNGLPATTVTFSESGAGSLSALTCDTNASGQCSVTFTAESAETVSVSATAESESIGSIDITVTDCQSPILNPISGATVGCSD